MNDPGETEPIKQAADAVEQNKTRRDSGDLGEEHDYRNPNRYWFESTACPLIAGTFGPMATAFSICALSSSWRVYMPPGVPEDQGTTIDDPRWLLAINAISLTLALVANGALLLNMSRRLRFQIAQPITIVGFLLSSGLLVVDLAVLTASHRYRLPASSPAAPGPSHALTSAFYYAIMAASIYLIIALLMCMTVWGAYKGHYATRFHLTVAQRTLMLQTMSFFTYMLLGALVFSKVEGWEFLDAVYWADVTLLTVGLGDFSPKTHTGRSLFIPFAIGGIVTIGLVISSIRSLVLERGQKKISARMMEKKRLRAIDSISNGKQRMRVSRFQTIRFVESYTNASEKRENEFRAMRIVQDCAERDRKWIALAVSTTAAFALWLIGAAVFMIAEYKQGWTYFQSMYFTYACLLTIGYGDFTPTANSSRPFFVLWSLLAVPTLTVLISDMSDTVVQAFTKLTDWIGALTVLPGEQGFRASAISVLKSLPIGKARNHIPDADEETRLTIKDRIADRLTEHLEAQELQEALEADSSGDTLERDIHFYHFILAREVQRLMKDLNANPPKRYSWAEWEYFLRLMGNDNYSDNHERLIPEELHFPETREQWYRKHREHRWSWLSGESPLLGHRSETEWILEKLGASLERELRESRLLPGRKRERVEPPVSMADMIKKEKVRRRGPGKEKEVVDDLMNGNGMENPENASS